jgi:hypothetical protein
MDYLIIEGVRPYDGRYEFDLEGQEFTTREWGWIRRHANYLPVTASDGFVSGDAELMCTIAVILLRRAGKITTEDVPEAFERLADAPFTATLKWETTQADEALEGDTADPTASLNGSTSSSGSVSPTSSESSGGDPKGSGIPASAISGSSPVTSGN